MDKLDILELNLISKTDKSLEGISGMPCLCIYRVTITVMIEWDAALGLYDLSLESLILILSFS